MASGSNFNLHRQVGQRGVNLLNPSPNSTETAMSSKSRPCVRSSRMNVN